MTLGIEGASQPLPSKGTIKIYCLAAMVAEEARQAGCDDFASDLEEALDRLIATLPRAEKREALMLSFEMAMAMAKATTAGEPAPPHLRLVYSRD